VTATPEHEESRRLQPDATYTSGFSKNVEFLLAPWFVIFGIAFAAIVLFVPPDPYVHQAPPPPGWDQTMVIGMGALVLVGLVFGYFAFFRRAYRLELVGHTLSWFLPFRRQLGRVPVSDIVEIWSTPTFNWRVRNSVISLRDGRKITIRKRAALDEFVAKLQVISPEIYVGDW
jgi:hypothetical protein